MLSRLPLVTKIALITAILIVLTALAVGGGAVMQIRGEIAQQVIDRQNNSLRTLAVLVRKAFPDTKFEIDAQGRVGRVTMTAIPDFAEHDMIDEIGKVTGETATLFRWQDAEQDFFRRTTNIINAEGKRAVGTPLGKASAAYAPVAQGRTYLGEAVILGKPYYTVYHPVYDPAGKIIGILYAGVLKTNIEAFVDKIAWQVLITGAIAVILGVAIALIMNRMLLRPLPRIAGWTEQLAQNDMNVEIEYRDRRDEIGILARAVDELKQTSIGAARAQSGLENVTTNVMIADERNVIVYCNKAVIATLKNAQSDLRKDLPHFDADDLIGKNVDVFHKNPAHQQKLLASLTTTYRTRITVGGRIFDLIANPALNKRGERVGTVVEWADRTEEVRLGNEVVALVQGATDNGFADRIDLTGKTGFIKSLSEAINSMSDKCQAMTGEIASVISAMAQGDLTQRLDKDYPGIFGQLKTGATAMADRLRDFATRLTDTARTVRDASGEISSGSQDLASRTESQAASIEETAASMHEITTTVKQNADNAQAANQLAVVARDTAEKGGSVVADAVTAVTQIEESAQKIADIVGLIDEIAFQTNLLALNASVEAARAGEAGKGFAVVAQEVRALAQRSANASKDIKALIATSNAQVKTGAALVNQTGSSLTDIVTAIKKVSDIVAEIAAASREQATGLDQVNTAVGSMDEMTQRNGALVEETSASAQSLANQGRQLAELVSFFKLGNSAAAAAMRPAPVATPVAAPAVKSAQSAVKPATVVAKAPPPAPKPAAPAKPAPAAAPAKDDDDWQEF
ncbi:methyl-accepting chemotaxis protein [Ferrovibrio terrae]|uniref:methyl-accepting chemotaxis protein n=1 Tax=Ferrovibrio terrae TaxID=2594003 RepID=UPI0031383F58